MRALCCADDLLTHAHRVGEVELHLTDLGDGDLDFDDIFESCGTLVVALDGNDGGEDALSLNLVEAEAEMVQEVDTGFLHETDVVGMMRHAHAVAFIVFHFVLIDVHDMGLKNLTFAVVLSDACLHEVHEQRMWLKHR